MITRGKNLQFYIWQKDGGKIQVIGERLLGSKLNFKFFLNKEEIEDESGELLKLFLEELTNQERSKKF